MLRRARHKCRVRLEDRLVRIMTVLNEQEFLVLNGAHLKKMATAEELASAIGLGAAEVEATLSKAIDSGLAMTAEGRHLLLPDGTSAVQEYYRSAYAALRTNDLVLAWYDRFEAI